MKAIPLAGFFFIFLFSKGQGLNNIWMLGYDTILNVQTPKMTIDFSSGSPVITNSNRVMNMVATNAVISDENGNLLFYSNGIFIANANHDTLLNGNDLNPSPWTSQSSYLGLNMPQANLIIPVPGDSVKYFLFHVTADSLGYIPTFLYYSIIDMTLDGGLGKVISKNNILLHSGFSFGGLTACKHANGRDWWLLAHEISTDKYFKFLITPTGILGPFAQNIGKYIINPGVGQLVFSPNGKYFANYDPELGLDLLEFDRCTDVFSNLVHVDFNDSAQLGGAAFSPNSEVLYLSSGKYVYQFDVTATNIPSTQTIVAIWDGYYSPGPPFATTFYLSQLAADGKIYINCQNGTKDIHVINFPDSIGQGCDVCQHCIHLPSYNAYTIPNYPNYFLGAEGGTICDSLPTGTIPADGVTLDDIIIYPNPSIGKFSVVSERYGIENITIYNLLGENVYQDENPKLKQKTEFDLSFLPEGVYTISFRTNLGRISTKIVKMSD